MTSGLFRKPPPWPTIQKVLSLIGISTEPTNQFVKTDLVLNNEIEAEVVALLEPQYYPNKAKVYLSQLSYNRLITILRQILATHGYHLIAHETTRQKKKAIVQHIEKADSNPDTLESPIVIDFS